MTISLEILSTNATVPATAFSNLIASTTTTDKEVPALFMHEQLRTGKGMVKEVSKKNIPLQFMFIISGRMIRQVGDIHLKIIS